MIIPAIRINKKLLLLIKLVPTVNKLDSLTIMMLFHPTKILVRIKKHKKNKATMPN